MILHQIGSLIDPEVGIGQAPWISSTSLPAPKVAEYVWMPLTGAMPVATGVGMAGWHRDRHPAVLCENRRGKKQSEGQGKEGVGKLLCGMADLFGGKR